MNKYICILLLSLSFNLYAADECTDWDKLDDTQRATLRSIHQYGAKYNLGYSLSAIALNESSAGRFRLNYHTNDFGVMMINITTASNILGVTNHYKKLELAQRLIYDDNLSMYLAVDVLNHFNKVHNGDWKKMIMSYNGGYKWQTDMNVHKSVEKYLIKVQKSVKLLQKCMK